VSGRTRGVGGGGTARRGDRAEGAAAARAGPQNPPTPTPSRSARRPLLDELARDARALVAPAVAVLAALWERAWGHALALGAGPLAARGAALWGQLAAAAVPPARDALARARAPAAEALRRAAPLAADALAAAARSPLAAGPLAYAGKWRRLVDAQLSGQPPLLVAALAVAVYLAAALAARLARGAWARHLNGRSRRQAFFDAVKAAPVVRWIVAAEQAKVLRSVRAGIVRDEATRLVALPAAGSPAEEVLRRMGAREARDVRAPGDRCTVSGTLYARGDECLSLMRKAYELFALTNPLHVDVFPSVRQMEAEVVAMTASFLGGGPAGGCPGVCGAMTSGGTESILSAVKASRDYVSARRHVPEPEMVLAESAHPAYFKAADMFRIRVVRVPVRRQDGYRLTAEAVARAVTRRTVVVVASAPGYPHGVVDDVAGIAAVAARRGACCHVDACLGGFFLPFARRAGRDVPPMDFSVPGVTSMSVDTHKFGMAHKGTSVVLYRDAALRRCQFTAVTDWSGGLYISPGFAGSKSGALIATAWAAMVYHGSEGYERLASELMDTRDVFLAGLRAAVPELEVVGDPAMSLVAFKVRDDLARKLNIYHVLDLVSRKGWHLSPLQRPAALHMCFTARSARSAEALVADLREAVTAALVGGAPKGGMAPVYGMAGSLPDRGAVADILLAYQDAMMEP